MDRCPAPNWAFTSAVSEVWGPRKNQSLRISFPGGGDWLGREQRLRLGMRMARFRVARAASWSASLTVG